MKRLTPPKGKRGGKRPGAGRKPGSIEPEKRTWLAKAYALRIAEIMRIAEERGPNPTTRLVASSHAPRRWSTYDAAVYQAHQEAYAIDHPNGVDEYGKPLNWDHFDKYRKNPTQMCKTGKRDLDLPPGRGRLTDFAEENS